MADRSRDPEDGPQQEHAGERGQEHEPDLTAAVDEPEPGKQRWECPQGRELYEEDLGVCPTHDVPLKKVGHWGEPVADELREGGEGSAEDLSTGPAQGPDRAQDARLQGDRPHKSDH